MKSVVATADPRSRKSEHRFAASTSARSASRQALSSPPGGTERKLPMSDRVIVFDTTLRDARGRRCAPVSSRHLFRDRFDRCARGASLPRSDGRRRPTGGASCTGWPPPARRLRPGSLATTRSSKISKRLFSERCGTRGSPPPVSCLPTAITPDEPSGGPYTGPNTATSAPPSRWN
jgi:hypothetical protein